jgi:NAD(P)-dependent dehydrogenase (short-subunit alcohol dehydrogenase family)
VLAFAEGRGSDETETEVMAIVHPSFLRARGLFDLDLGSIRATAARATTRLDVASAMAWTTADIPDQASRVAVVTGANGGLGLEAARELARKGAHVVMAARDQAKAHEAVRSLLDDIPRASLELQPLDLASLDSVREAAGRIVADHPRIDILVNNAGVMGIPQRRTVDGFEMQLGVNHLGHFALTALLLPAVLRSGDARIVSVTSTGRHIGRGLDPANPHLIGSYDPWRAYGQSKLANVHFALELDRRFRAARTAARSIVVHPGFTYTDLQERSVRETDGGWSQRFFRAAVRRFGMTPSQGTLVLLRAATDPAAVGGALYTPMWVVSGPPVRRPMFGRSRNPEAMAVLWEVSERETGISLRIEPR